MAAVNNFSGNWKESDLISVWFEVFYEQIN